MTLLTSRLGGLNSSLAIKAPARAKTATNITLSGFQTIDGVVLADGDANLRVLVADQTDASQNGIYDAQSGSWTRAKDFDSNNDFERGTRVFVCEGTLGPGEWRVTSADPMVIDTDDIDFDATDAPGAIEFVLDGGGGVVDAGTKGFLEMPFAGTITGWKLVGDVVGSMVVDIYKDTYANFPPTVADTITGTDKPTISSAQKGSGSALTGWTTAFGVGDWLAFHVDSCAAISRATLSLSIRRN